MTRAAELGAPQEQRQRQVDVARVEVRPEREAEQDHEDRGLERPLAVRPVDRPEQDEDRPAAPDVPGDVPRHQRPRREQRQHPRGVDVGQERAGRAVRVAAAEPDPDRRPVRPGVGAGRLAAGDQPGRQAAERDDQQRHREEPAPVVEPADLVAERPPEDVGQRRRVAGRLAPGGRPRPSGGARRRRPGSASVVSSPGHSGHDAATRRGPDAVRSGRDRPAGVRRAILPRTEARSARP